MSNVQPGSTAQPGILDELPRHARYLYFDLIKSTDADTILSVLSGINIEDKTVVGIGQSVAQKLGKTIPGLLCFPAKAGPAIEIPSTPSALWCWIRDDDRGKLVHKTLEIKQQLAPAFTLEHVIDAFQYKDSRDLSGYIDGTENPTDEDAVRTAILNGQGDGLDGSSFVAVQQWVHDLDFMTSLPQHQQDDIFGRRISDNEEMDDAPESAHVKRTAQESFQPEAFVVRRSMPWAEGECQGLVFVAFGKNFDAFDALLNRMIGAEDGIVDALFQFTQPVNGSYYWCPPLKDGSLDLSALNK